MDTHLTILEEILEQLTRSHDKELEQEAITTLNTIKIELYGVQSKEKKVYVEKIKRLEDRLNRICLIPLKKTQGIALATSQSALATSQSATESYKKLLEAKQQLIESEQIAVETLENLSKQREKLDKTKSTLEASQNELNKSSRLVKSISSFWK